MPLSLTELYDEYVKKIKKQQKDVLATYGLDLKDATYGNLDRSTEVWWGNGAIRGGGIINVPLQYEVNPIEAEVNDVQDVKFE